MAEYTIDKFTFGGNTYNIEQPTIPTNVSAFTNDAGYLTAHQTIPVTDVRLNGSSIVSSGIANITDTSGNLSINGALTAGGNITIPNNYIYKSKNTSNTERNLLRYNTENNLIIGSYSQRGDYDSEESIGGGILLFGKYVSLYTNSDTTATGDRSLLINSSGDATFSGNITANGHSTHIGYTTDTISSSVNVTTGSTWKTISSPTLTVSEGTWIIFATISVPGSTTGDRAVGITYNSQSGNIAMSRHIQRAAAGSSIAAILNTSTIVDVPAAGRTYQIELFQNSGSTQSVTGYLRAVRIA